MAVIYVREQFDRRRSSVRDGKVVHVRAFLVKCDDPMDGTAAALVGVDFDDSDIRVPQPGDILLPPGTEPAPNTIYPRVTSVDVDPWQNSDVHFQVLVEYTLPDLPAADDPSPLVAPVELTYSYNEATEPVFLDTSDPPKPYVNSAGDAFEQFYERETGQLQIQIVRNVATFNAVAMDLFKHTTNAAPIVIDGTTFAAGTCKMSPITATRQTTTIQQDGVQKVITFYKRTMLIKARHEGWDHIVQDVGMNERVGTTGNWKPTPILDAVGAPVKKPWPLDGGGKKQATVDATPVNLEFKPYKSADWSSLTFD